MMKKRWKQGGALILAAVLVISAFVIPKSFAAVGVENRDDCTMELQYNKYVELVGDEERGIEALDVPVRLYKIADINVSGEYTVLDSFSDCEKYEALVEKVNDVSSETTSEAWDAILADAEAVVAESQVDADKDTIIEDGYVKITGISVGLYLIQVDGVDSDYYHYETASSLVSVPNNYFYTSGNDDWIYNLEKQYAISLKPERTDRYGDLIIDKDLLSYNETLGTAYFVFQVEASKTDVDTGSVEKVYSNVVSLAMNGTGMESIYIDNIPAGADVTVTEVYSGASYEFKYSEILNSADEMTEDGKFEKLIIIADEDERGTAEIEFVNDFNEGLNKGTGLVNNFVYSDGQWQEPFPTEDSKAPEQ